tara:strand:- start:326 stop:1501 length:1176 start_codon:yes stop_codon:yes gene_type:complete
MEKLLVMKRNNFILLILLLISTVSIGQEEKKKQWMELNGYLKFMQTIGIAKDTNILVNNLWYNRLNFKLHLSPKSTINAQFRNRLFYGDNVSNIPNYGELINTYDGVFPLEWLVVDNSSIVLSVIADRLYYDYTSDKIQFRGGRQRINWGINTTWNPNDIFNSYNIYDFDYEEREGSDALRLKLFPNYFSSVDIAYKFTNNFKTDVGAIMYKFNKSNYDIQLLAGKFMENISVGGGWAGSIKTMGFKGEATYFIPYTAVGFHNVSVSTTIDYSWSNGSALMATYLYNSSGTNTVIDPTVQIITIPNAEKLMPAKHNTMVNYTKQLSPISGLNIGLLYSYGINSMVLFPTYTFNIKTNLDLDLIGQLFFSELPNEEFSNVGNGLYWRLKMSF